MDIEGLQLLRLSGVDFITCQLRNNYCFRLLPSFARGLRLPWVAALVRVWCRLRKVAAWLCVTVQWVPCFVSVLAV